MSRDHNSFNLTAFFASQGWKNADTRFSCRLSYREYLPTSLVRTVATKPTSSSRFVASDELRRSAAYRIAVRRFARRVARAASGLLLPQTWVLGADGEASAVVGHHPDPVPAGGERPEAGARAHVRREVVVELFQDVQHAALLLREHSAALCEEKIASCLIRPLVLELSTDF